MNEQEILTFARNLAERKAHVLHTEFGVVGVAAKAWPPGTYFGKATGRFVPAVVLGLEDGNAFVLEDDDEDEGAGLPIVELTPAEVAVHERLVTNLGFVLTGAIVEMNNRTKDKTRLPIALAVLGAALAAQLRSLRAGKG